MLSYSTAVIGLLVAQHLFDMGVSQRQLGRLEHRSLPAALRKYFSLLGTAKEGEDKFMASQDYARDKLKLSQFLQVLDLFESVLLYTPIVSSRLLGSAHPVTGLKAIWDYAGSFDLIKGRGEIAQSLAFVVCLSLISQITSIPISLYKPFVLEAKHGFNKMTLATWCKDFVKGQLLAAGLGLPLIAALLKTMQWAGPSFVTYTMLLLVSIQLVMIPAYPYLLAPIFNDYRALSDPKFKDKANYAEVGSRVEKLAGRLNFPLGKLWVMDGSKRSAHSNAFFYGLPYLTKHIVLYDTLLDQSSPEEVEAVLAHELGHWHFNHSLYMMMMSEIILLVNLTMIRMSIFNPALYRAFSFTTQKPLIIGLLMSQALLSPIDTITSFVVNAFSRKNEFQADKFAVDLADHEHPYGDKLKHALVKLGSENKSVTDVDPIYSAYHHSHPTMPERISRLDDLTATQTKKQ